LSISLAIKWDDLPAEWQQMVGEKLGLPPTSALAIKAGLKTFDQLAQAGKSAQELIAEPEEEQPVGKSPKRKPGNG
jgi:hypothetical protein